MGTTCLALRRVLFIALATSAFTAMAEAQQSSTGFESVIVTARQTTRSSVELNGVEDQKLLPGMSPLKAINTLPGVVYLTADPWGNNEQNESLVIHGFTTQQLGYTMDGVPLGDQQYGNYNGLSPSRALTSENVDRVVLSSGAGSLGVASTSNLGGAIETFSVDPDDKFGVDLRETWGSNYAWRSFLKVNTGDLGGGNAAYVSYLHHDQRAWDFDGHQKGDQVNLKFVHDDEAGKLTIYGDWQAKVEPNEDATGYGNQQTTASTYFPYARAFLYPNYNAALAYLTNGTPAASLGNNYSNYHSAAQRLDGLGYVQYDWKLASGMTWSNQAYFHHVSGRGIVAGPVNAAGLPGLFAIYYPQLVVGGSSTSAGTLANIVNVFGGTGYEVRATEYRINRFGERSTFNWQLGDHQIEAGIWYERNYSRQGRRWYPFSAANDDLTPYTTPRNPAFTQYDITFHTTDVQLHIEDQWHILPDLLLQAGLKSSLQTADDTVNIQQQNLAAGNPYKLAATNPPVNYPTGELTSNRWLLPQLGAVWDASDHEQFFFNIQKNVRQFIPYGAGSNFYGTSPWSLGSQDAFESFKATGKPESSWTYEAGARTRRDVAFGPLSSISGQINYYHVNFSNRLLNVAAYNFINPNPAVLVNVGGVTTDGVDLAVTFGFGDHFHIYDALSYNKSTYDSDYQTATGTNGTSGQTTVKTGGKNVPLAPNLLNKFIVSTDWAGFEAQFTGELVGRRYATYLNDMTTPSTFIMGLEASYIFDIPGGNLIHNLKISGNLTNLGQEKGFSTVVVTGASGGYQAFPIAPRMWFLTLGTAL